jgi:sugar porter (SP) family MFS transporter
LIAFLTNFLLRGIGDEAWRWMLGIMVIPAGIFALLVRTIPESPRWLVLKGRDSEAMRVFEKTGEPDAITLVREEHELSKLGTAERLFSGKFNKPVFYAVLLAMFNQLSGINAIIYYAPRIFEMTGLAKDTALLQAVSIGATNLIFTLLAISLIDKFGRKTLLIIGSVGMVVFLGLVASVFFSQDFGGYAVMIYLVGFIAFFAFSQGAVIWVFISEIFPNRFRAQGQAIGSFTHWIFAALLTTFFPTMVSSFPPGYVFLFFCGMMVLQLIWVKTMVVETKGVPLELIEQKLGVHS